MRSADCARAAVAAAAASHYTPIDVGEKAERDFVRGTWIGEAVDVHRVVGDANLLADSRIQLVVADRRPVAARRVWNLEESRSTPLALDAPKVRRPQNVVSTRRAEVASKRREQTAAASLNADFDREAAQTAVL